MAVAISPESTHYRVNPMPGLAHFLHGRENLGRQERAESSTTIEAPAIGRVPEKALTESLEKLERDREFAIAYEALADRRGVNATPSGRSQTRKLWLVAGPVAAKWLIEQIKTETHPDMIVGVAETITEMGAVAMPIALSEIERYADAKPEFEALIDALAWMDPPEQPELLSRINNIIDRYLKSPQLECKLAAVQLTRLLDDKEAHAILNDAMENSGQRLREEIEDLLNERFDD
jgi:hypothetical protein